MMKKLSPSIIYTTAEENLSKKVARELETADPEDPERVIAENTLPSGKFILAEEQSMNDLPWLNWDEKRRSWVI